MHIFLGGQVTDANVSGVNISGCKCFWVKNFLGDNFSGWLNFWMVKILMNMFHCTQSTVSSISSKLPAPDTDTADLLASLLHDQGLRTPVGHKESDAIILDNSDNLNREHLIY